METIPITEAKARIAVPPYTVIGYHSARRGTTTLGMSVILLGVMVPPAVRRYSRVSR
jgi:hypothetical protein